VSNKIIILGVIVSFHVVNPDPGFYSKLQYYRGYTIMHELVRLIFYYLSCCTVVRQPNSRIWSSSIFENQEMIGKQGYVSVNALEILLSVQPAVAYEIMSYLDDPYDLRLLSKEYSDSFDKIHEKLLESCLAYRITNLPTLKHSAKLQIKLARRFFPLLRGLFAGCDSESDRDARACGAGRKETKSANLIFPYTGELSEHSIEKKVGTLNAVIEFLHARLPEGRDDLIFFLDFLIYCGAFWAPDHQRALLVLMCGEREDYLLTYKVMRVLKIKSISELRLHHYPKDLQKMIGELEQFHLEQNVMATISQMRLQSLMLKTNACSSDLNHTYFEEDRCVFF
jgi:hypothetical protein